MLDHMFRKFKNVDEENLALPGIKDAIYLRLIQWQNEQTLVDLSDWIDEIWNLIDAQDFISWKAMGFGIVHKLLP